MAKAKETADKKTMKIMVTPHEQVLLKLAANLQGKSASGYMKGIALIQAEKDLKVSGIDPEKLKRSI